MASITPGNWINALGGAAESRATEEGEHQYIAVIAGSHEYRVIDSSQINRVNPKLSIQQIVDISKVKLHELGEALGALNEGQRVEREDILSQARQISQFTEELIKGKEDKGWLRIAAHTFIAFFKALGLGLIFDFDYLKHLVNQVTEEASLRAKLNQARPEILGPMYRIPQGLEELEMRVTDENRTEAIQQTISQLVTSRDANNITRQFRLDMERGCSFLRKDGRINDQEQVDHRRRVQKPKTPKPSPQTKGEERVSEGIQALRELSQNDPQWDAVLQIATTQTSLNCVFHAVIQMFNGQATDIWMEDDMDCGIKAAFPGKLPPVSLEIIRDSSERITSVNVEVDSFIEVIKYNAQNGEKLETINPKAIKGHLQYTITLENGEPRISGLRTEIGVPR